MMTDGWFLSRSTMRTRAVQVRGEPRGVVAEGAFRLVTHPVRLDVGLVDHVEAVFVAEVVPLGHVGVVARYARR